MSYIYKKTIDLHLKTWIKFLSEDEKLSFNAELESGEWHSILENNEVIAIFQILTNKNDKSAKSLSINFNNHYFKNIGVSIDIILFIYDSMLDICKNENIFKLKLHIKEKFVKDVFDMIVGYEIKHANKITNLKTYGAWIDFEIIKDTV